MNPLRYMVQVLREFSRRWGSYLLIVGSISGLTTVVVIPILRWATSKLLSWGHIPYLSYDNAVNVTLHHPGIMFSLVLLALFVLVLVYLQFALFLGGIDNIRRRQGLPVRAVIWEGLRDLRHLHWSSFGFFIIYTLLIVPLAGLVINSSLLAKVQVPTFVIEWLVTKPLFGVFVLLFYGIMLYLGLRLIRLLPNAILNDLSFWPAAKRSWTQTRGHFWFYTLRILVLTVTLTALTYIWSGLWIVIQTWADSTAFAFIFAVGTMTALFSGRLILGGVATVCYLLFLAAPEDVLAGQAVVTRKEPHHWLRRIGVVGLMGVALALVVAYDGAYMYGALDDHPLTISHRGVDDQNGVQNTIPALRKTAKERPDFVEMDLHETKDGEFVVMHDENLKALTGVNKRPRQLTLAQLTHLTASENGHHAKVASFDAYLNAAEQLHQKLLVELKTTNQDSPQMINNFAKHYGARLVADHDRVHSLNYSALVQLKKQTPKLYSSFIMPYSLVFPQTQLNAYTVEETTLNDDFVDSAHQQHQAVLAWTVNDTDEMNQMLFVGADGIITDHLYLLQKTIAQHDDHPAYAQRLRLFSDTLDTLNQPTVEN